jgi:hypothetical protein
MVILFKDGNWGQWSLFSVCSVTCNGVIKTRTRSCNSPAPQNSGKNCFGEDTEIVPCSQSPCSISKNQHNFYILHKTFFRFGSSNFCSNTNINQTFKTFTLTNLTHLQLAYSLIRLRQGFSIPQ